MIKYSFRKKNFITNLAYMYACMHVCLFDDDNNSGIKIIPKKKILIFLNYYSYYLSLNLVDSDQYKLTIITSNKCFGYE